MTSNRDQSGMVVRSGHTVRLGASVGRVLSVAKGSASVHWISGADTFERTTRLVVNRTLGRVQPPRGAA